MFKTISTTFIILLFYKSLFSQNLKPQLSVGQKASLLIEVLNRNHCEPQTIDNTFSQKLFKTYIENLDPEKDILTKEDIAETKNFEFLLDDQIKSKNIVFIPKIAQITKARLKIQDSLIVAITEKPININSKFSYIPVYDSLASNEAELKTRLQRNLKYKIFNNLYYSLLDTHTLLISPDYLNFEKIKIKEKTSREQVRDSFRNRLKASLEFNNQELIEKFEILFLQTIAELFDNHSEYFESEDVVDFVDSMNPESEVFGFGLEENKKGEIIIGELLPGGPAWNCGLINEGDLLINFTFEGQKTINAIGSDIYELEEIISKEKGKIITLTIRKPSKEIQTIQLTKELILLENESVRGLILEKKGKFGYINLPSFYSDNESEDQLGCANDVAKELLKMKDDNIKGLIFDLRFNGGGSVKEALDLAGIFIDQGIFGAAMPQKGKSVLLKDPNRGSIFDGPLVVLVNQASASASEIFAAILQDYNRAVIVGSNTFGKGVAQGFMPLDSFNKEPKYYAKATVWRVFSPSGKAIQHFGVVPDIRLPSILDGTGIAELNEPFSLSPKILDRTLSFTPEPKLPIQSLQENSKNRLEKKQNFSSIVKIANMIEESIKNEKLIEELTWEIYCKKQQEMEKTYETINTESKKALFKVNVPTRDLERTKIDLLWNKLNEKLFDRISKDVYIEESLEILNNLNE